LASELISQSMADKSWDTYGTGWRSWMRFCDEADIDALQATEFEVVCYIAWIGMRGTIKAETMGPYLSSINKVYELFYEADDATRFVPPARGPLVTAAKKGLIKRQYQTIRPQQRTYLPANAVVRVLQHAEALDFSDENLPEHRAAAAVLLGSMTATRADSLLDITLANVAFSTNQVAVTITKTKGHDDEPARVLIFHREGCPRVWDYLENYSSWLRTQVAPTHLFLRRPGENWRNIGKSTLLTGWLQTILGILEIFPPAGLYYSSHSLRKGAATSMHAVGVSIDIIRFLGGWVPGSTAVFEYIDLMAPATPAARFLFSSLRRT
jgi:integrase